MKSELRGSGHLIGSGQVIEVWHDGKLVACVYGRENGPGVRIISKHVLASVDRVCGDGTSDTEVMVRE